MDFKLLFMDVMPAQFKEEADDQFDFVFSTFRKLEGKKMKKETIIPHLKGKEVEIIKFYSWQYIYTNKRVIYAN